MDKDRGKMGIGVVVRVHEAEVLATLLAPRLHTNDLVMVEATVALRGAIFSWELGHHKVDLEGDALQIV